MWYDLLLVLVDHVDGGFYTVTHVTALVGTVGRGHRGWRWEVVVTG